MAEFDDLDGLDDLGDLEEISFDDTNPVLSDPLLDDPLPGAAPQPIAAPPGAPQPGAAPPPTGGLGAVIYDLISKRNYQQVIQIAESQKSAIEQDPQAKALVENAKTQLQQEAQLKSYVEGARQAVAAGQAAQAEAFMAKAREIDPGHPDIQAFEASAQPMAAAPEPMAAPPGAPQPAAPQPMAAPPATPQAGPDLLSFDEPPLTLEEPNFELGGSLPDLDLSAPEPAAPEPAAPQPAAPTTDFAMPAPAPASPAPAADFAMPAPAPAAPAPAADFAMPAPAPAASAPAADFAMPAPAPAAPAADFAMPGPAAPGPAAPEPGAPQPAAPQPMAAPAALDGGDFGDLSLDPETLPEGFEPAGLDAPAPMAPDSDPAAEGQDRIPALIEEGQAQFQQGQYQAAIDTWSRIFLIDIDHAQASQLIEQAQNKKAELERQAEELFHSALEQIELQQLEEAKESLARALELQPSHTTAREYLDQLNAGQVPTVSLSSGTGEIDLLDDGGLGAFDGSDLAAASGIDPGQSMEAAVARDRVVVVKKTDRKLIGIAAVVGFLVLGGGGFLALKWNDLFPNTSKPKESARQMDPIDRATKMFEAGKIENAVLLLEKISAEEEGFGEAQALIAQWRTQLEAAAKPQDTGPSPEMVARRNLLLRAARDAAQKQEYIRARKYFDRANKISPLESDDLALLRECNYQLEPLEPRIAEFAEGKYAEVLPQLWRLRETAPDDPNIKLLMVDSYYNLALTDLQRGNPKGAANKLADALEIEPDNEELIRMRLFAETYSNRAQDLLYRIYVKYLPSRS